MLVDDDGCVRVGVRPDDDAKTVDLLAACRAFGDADFKRPKPVVVATPDVRTMQLDSDCEFIVLCTDGVYEGLPTDERGVAGASGYRRRRVRQRRRRARGGRRRAAAGQATMT